MEKDNKMPTLKKKESIKNCFVKGEQKND